MVSKYLRSALLWRSLVVLVCLFPVDVMTTPLTRVVRDADSGDAVTLSTPQGQLKGQKVEEGNQTLGVFWSIPYALPPVGERRFGPPQAASNWTGVRDATSHLGRCMHKPLQGDPVLTGVPDTEDCLFVDVYTPLINSTVDGNSLVPVMLYVHGGSFEGGSGALYNFTNLALRGVVVVTVNFRLDILGFLSTEDENIPGNFALLDVLMAMNWVQDNIAAFGGDANDVTLFGGSSGAAMVSALLLSPSSQGLCHKAIMQSGVSLLPWALYQTDVAARKPRRLAGMLGSLLNCSFEQQASSSTEYNSEMLLMCLRNRTLEELWNASIAMKTGIDPNNILWAMVAGPSSETLPDTPAKLLARERDPLPTIYGYTAQDGSWLMPLAGYGPDGVSLQLFESLVNASLRTWYAPEDHEQVYQDVMALYLPNGGAGKTGVELRDILVVAMTDVSMAAFMVQEARMYGKTKSYMFEFNHRPSYSSFRPEWFGVTHTAEKGFVQGLPQGPVGYSYPAVTDSDQAVMDHVLTMWSNFAKYSNPTPSPLEGVTWPHFHQASGQESLLVIQENMTVKAFDRREMVKVWTDPLVGEEPVGKALTITPHYPLVILASTVLVLTRLLNI